MSSKITSLSLIILRLCLAVLSGPADNSVYNKPHKGPPAAYFAADSSIPIAALQSAAEKCSVTHGASYSISKGDSANSTIYSDWASFTEAAAIVWTADMDVDCDGVDYKCEGNGDGLPQTTWGALAAYAVPFIVIPDAYYSANKKALPGNNVAAVICNGNMFYGILGDTNGDTPQVAGEASWLMARTCFPDDGLYGAKGHSEADVTYIVFLGDTAVLPNQAMDKNYITDFDVLKTMGDRLVYALVQNIGLGESGPGSGIQVQTQSSAATATKGFFPPTTFRRATVPAALTPTTTHGSCSLEGHCEDVSCLMDQDCSDDLICSDGNCSADDDDEDEDDDDEDELEDEDEDGEHHGSSSYWN
ncbi:Chitosanase-domain-containing protein [Aspergillus californicus]